MRSVASEYPFLSSPVTHRSPAGTTSEWLEDLLDERWEDKIEATA
jgi:hypothetical protein